MKMFQVFVPVFLALSWTIATEDLAAQQPPPPRPPERSGGADAPPGPRDGRPGGPPPPGKRRDRDPFGGPRDAGPPQDGPFGGPRGEPAPQDPFGGPPRDPFGRHHEMRLLEQLKERDPELYELEKADREMERQSLELSEQIRRAPRDAREPLEEQLAELVAKHFDVRQSRRELHLKRLTEELEKLRQSFEQRREVRDEIIGRRVSELMGEEDDLAF